MAEIQFQSRWKVYFKLLLYVFLLSLLAYIVIQISTLLIKQRMSDLQVQQEQQQEALKGYTGLTGFTKLLAVKELETNVKEIPWTTHIQKVFSMLESLKRVDYAEGESILLSDFQVSLEKVSLQGHVSNLLLLYYSSPAKGIVSLIDRFAELDFIQNMKIKSYTYAEDGFDFVLEANVVNDGK